MKEKITILQQIIIGGFIKFKELKILDIRVLVETLQVKTGINIDDEELDKTIEQINSIGGLIKLDILSSNFLSNETLLQSNLITDFYKQLDIEEFVLRKVNSLNGLRFDDTDIFFNKNEQDVLNKLDDKGYLTTVWNDDFIYDDYKETKLSQWGKRELFGIDNSEEIMTFKQTLKDSGYDITLVNDFLRSQDFDQPADTILTIDNFTSFCCTYDRCPYALEKSTKQLYKYIKRS